MRSPLKKFTDYSNTLLPHETLYLLSVQKFKDPERLKILQRVNFNAHHINQFVAYDLSIDKRTYNHLQNWIKEQLLAIDVDEQLKWIMALEQKIMTDSIEPQEEKSLLKAIKKYEHPVFFFIKFYELVEHYRHFLLIRIRYEDHRLTDHFLEKYNKDYKAAKAVHDKLHKATLDIIGQYSENSTESIHWQKWLNVVFYNEKTDGLNRYLALIRLVFIGFNYHNFELVKKQFDYLDEKFAQGKNYSRRILLNYYNNRLLLHSGFQEYEKAVYFGYLSTRAQNHDYTHYVNNLCAVLLRLDKNEEALTLMKNAAPVSKTTRNFHSKIGFVAFYMEAMLKNNRLKNAVNYGETFLHAFPKEVIQYRWHLFFSVFLKAILFQKNYDKILKLVRKYKLEKRDKAYQHKANYLPFIPLFSAYASYREGIVGESVFLELVADYLTEYKTDLHRLERLKIFLALFDVQVE